MPSTSLQSRISAFESLGGPLPSSTSPPRNSPKYLAKPPSQSLLETPLSPAASSLPPIVPFSPPSRHISRSPSPSPPNLGRKTSLIDLKDWIVDDGPSPSSQNGSGSRIGTNSNGLNNGNNIDYTRTPNQRGFDANNNGKKSYLGHNSAPLINLESPPKPRLNSSGKPPSNSNVKAPPLPPRKPSFTSVQGTSSSSSLPTQKSNGNTATSLQPPRRSDSLTVEHTYPPLSKLNISDATSRTGPGSGLGHAPASSISSFHSVSLSSDGGNGTDADPSTPGSVSSNCIATFPMDHPEYNTSGGGNGSEADSISLDESYENVSITSIASPTTAAIISLDWEKAMAKRKQPPKLPQRPASSTTAVSSFAKSTSPSSSHSVPTSPRIRPTTSASSASSTATARRAPPPPPPSQYSRPPSSRTSLTSTSASASDRSSILSTSTSRSSISTRPISLIHNSNHPAKTSLLRPTPVPATARKRYEAVFISNIVQRRKAERLADKQKPALLTPVEAKKTRQAAGWRGLSVDLITNPGDHPILGSGEEKEKENDQGLGEDDDWEDIAVGSDEQLDGYHVRLIWNKSKLDKEKLEDIWNECDSTNQGALDRNSFVKGMWRIDEELRRAQVKSSGSSGTSTGSFRIRQPPLSKPKPVAKPILR